MPASCTDTQPPEMTNEWLYFNHYFLFHCYRCRQGFIHRVPAGICTPAVDNEVLRCCCAPLLSASRRGKGRKPGPCGLRPVPCLHCSPIALWSSAPPSPVRTPSAALTSVGLPLSFRVSAVRNHGSARWRCGLLVPLDHCVSSSGCHSGTAQAGTETTLTAEDCL